jgi:hypothetical protein
MRNRFASTFYELGAEDQRLVIVVADISPAGSIAKFREDFPNRFINTGVAEQVMIGLCAGMAQRGLRPFAYTIATFSVFRPYEMIRDDLCYQDLPVTVVGIGGGVTYSTLGGTHHAMEDVALMTSLPNMSVIAPCDPEETAAATRWLATQNQHPAYLRLGKAGEPDLTSNAADPFVAKCDASARARAPLSSPTGPWSKWRSISQISSRHRPDCQLPSPRRTRSSRSMRMELHPSFAAMTASSSSKNMYRMEGLVPVSRKSPGITEHPAISVASRCEMNLFISMAPTKNCWRSTVLGCRK